MTRLTVAAAQYPIELLGSFSAWLAKLEGWVAEAAGAGADLLVFPEYAAMELAGIDAGRAGDLAASLELVIGQGDAYDAACRELANRHKVLLLAGSRPCRDETGRIVNRATLHGPEGTCGWQDKIVMTRFEREIWGVSGGRRVAPVATHFGPVGIAICYDIEFPLIARGLAEAGARIVLVPSATDSMQGYWRVRLGAQARALENQCFTVQAPTQGLAPWLPALDENHGAAGIFCPPDLDAPDDGVLACGTAGTPGWTYARIDLDQVPRWRREGAVLNHAHWGDQCVPGSAA